MFNAYSVIQDLKHGQVMGCFGYVGLLTVSFIIYFLKWHDQQYTCILQKVIKFLLYLDVDKSGIIFLKSGDKVEVNLTVKAFRQLQDNAMYGGWEEGMEQVSVWATWTRWL